MAIKILNLTTKKSSTFFGVCVRVGVFSLWHGVDLTVNDIFISQILEFKKLYCFVTSDFVSVHDKKNHVVNLNYCRSLSKRRTDWSLTG